MKKTTKIIAISTLVIGLSTTVFAFAGNGHWRMSAAEKAEFVNDRIATKLELSEIQKVELSALTDNILSFTSEMKAAKDDHKQLIQNLLAEPTLDQAKALEAIHQTTSMINSKAPETIASLAGFLDSLNEEQKSELQDFVKHKMNHRHGKH